MNDLELYEQCIHLAELSPCKKRGFGCVSQLPNGYVLTNGYNSPRLETIHVCEPDCIRMSIPSGADSMIGACSHAEEWAIWRMIHIFGNRYPQAADLYVAGVSKPDNIPLVKTEPHFYCIRCATLMLHAGIHGVNVWCNDKWHFLTPEEAYESSLQFALKQAKLEKGQS